MKFGRRAPAADHPRLKHPCHRAMAKYALGSLVVPPSADYIAPAASVLGNIYGNDLLGDCVIAGGYHLVGTATGNAGDLFTATQDQIIADYSAIGGYVPGDDSTDQGCDELTALSYWQEHGFANGTHLVGSLLIDASNQTEVQMAIWLFEGASMCASLPDAWISPMPSGNDFVWDVAGDPNPDHGHCVAAVGYHPGGVTIDSWALFGTVTWAALAKYFTMTANGSLFVWLTPDILAKGQAKAPTGFDWATLLQDFSAMGGAT